MRTLEGGRGGGEGEKGRGGGRGGGGKTKGGRGQTAGRRKARTKQGKEDRMQAMAVLVWFMYRTSSAEVI